MSLPSGHGAATMPHLERVMQLAYQHGYRVGLQIGDELVVIHVSDVTEDRKVIAIMAKTIESGAEQLFIEMLRRAYVPRHHLTEAG